MKVLRKGRKQKGWSKDYVCTGKGNGGGGCGAKLRVSETDLYHTHHYDYGGGHDVYTTFLCPCCGVETDVPYSDPPRVRGKRPSPEERETLRTPVAE